MNTQQEDRTKWNLSHIIEFAHTVLVHPEELSEEDLKGKSAKEIETILIELSRKNYEEKTAQLNGKEQVLEFEKVVILRVVDRKWTDHIDQMDQLRQGIGLRSYGQFNPLTEYQQEGFTLFEDMIGEIDYEVTRLLMKSQIRQNLQREQTSAKGKADRGKAKEAVFSHDEETHTRLG